MQQRYGMGYAEYNRKLENRMFVERQRDKDHRESLQIVSEFMTKIHRS